MQYQLIKITNSNVFINSYPRSYWFPARAGKKFRKNIIFQTIEEQSNRNEKILKIIYKNTNEKGNSKFLKSLYNKFKENVVSTTKEEITELVFYLEKIRDKKLLRKIIYEWLGLIPRI